MQIFVLPSYEGMSKKAADIVAAHIILNGKTVLGLATGSTPVGMYKQLVNKFKAGELDFSGVKSVNLDEYVGLAPSHKQSYRYFMQTNLFDHINIDKNNTYVPDGLGDIDNAGRYDDIIASLGGIDLQVLGIGHNGHIGFNEPSDSFAYGTHVVTLTESTISANSRFFDSRDEIPKLAVTMGIGSIMQAKQILLLASGFDKAEIIKEAFCGPITPRVPASVLQLHHNVILVGDEAALSKLVKK